jgi:hypothetical protein
MFNEILKASGASAPGITSGLTRMFVIVFVIFVLSEPNSLYQLCAAMAVGGLIELTILVGYASLQLDIHWSELLILKRSDFVGLRNGLLRRLG